MRNSDAVSQWQSSNVKVAKLHNVLFYIDGICAYQSYIWNQPINYLAFVQRQCSNLLCKHKQVKNDRHLL